MTRAMMSMATAPTIAATPTSSSPLLGSWKPKNVRRPRRATSTMPPRQRPAARIASSGDSRVPAAGGHGPRCAPRSRRSRRETCGTSLASTCGRLAAELRELVEQRSVSAVAERQAAVARQARVALVGHGDVDVELGGSRLVELAEAISPRPARSTSAVVKARRVARPSMTTAAAAGVRPGGGAGMRIEASSR